MTTHVPEEVIEQTMIATVNETLQKIRFFFKANGVGPRRGTSLLGEFLSFTFEGGATIHRSGNQSEELFVDSDLIDEWIDHIQPLIKKITEQNLELHQDIFSEDEQEFNNIEKLKGGFMDALFGKDHLLNDEVKDGTAVVIACMIAFKGESKGNLRFSENTIH